MPTNKPAATAKPATAKNRKSPARIATYELLLKSLLSALATLEDAVYCKAPGLTTLNTDAEDNLRRLLVHMEETTDILGEEYIFERFGGRGRRPRLTKVYAGA